MGGRTLSPHAKRQHAAGVVGVGFGSARAGCCPHLCSPCPKRAVEPFLPPFLALHPSLLVHRDGRAEVLCVVAGSEGGRGEGGLPDPPAWYDLPVGDGGHFDVMKVRWAPREGGREGGVEGKVGAVGRRIETMRLEGGGEEGAEGGEVEEEDEVFLIALMSSEYWCVCALNQ